MMMMIHWANLPEILSQLVPGLIAEDDYIGVRYTLQHSCCLLLRRRSWLTNGMRWSLWEERRCRNRCRSLFRMLKTLMWLNRTESFRSWCQMWTIEADMFSKTQLLECLQSTVAHHVTCWLMTQIVCCSLNWQFDRSGLFYFIYVKIWWHKLLFSSAI